MFSQSSLDAPPSPPGSRNRVLFNSNFPVNTLVVHVNAIDMHEAVQKSWTEPAEAARRSANGMNMAITNTAPSTVANQLQNRNVILRLFQTIYTVIEKQ